MARTTTKTLCSLHAEVVQSGDPMQVIAQWTGGKADALRQALRLTLESFADKLGVAPRTVAYWRKDPTIVPQAAVQQALDEALEAAPDRAKAQFVVAVGSDIRGHSMVPAVS